MTCTHSSDMSSLFFVLGRDAVVPSTRCVDGIEAVFNLNRYLVGRMHLCRDGLWSSFISRIIRQGSIAQDL